MESDNITLCARQICDLFAMTYFEIDYMGAKHWDDVEAIIRSAVAKKNDDDQFKIDNFDSLGDSFVATKEYIKELEKVVNVARKLRGVHRADSQYNEITLDMEDALNEFENKLL